MCFKIFCIAICIALFFSSNAKIEIIPNPHQIPHQTVNTPPQCQYACIKNRAEYSFRAEGSICEKGRADRISVYNSMFAITNGGSFCNIWVQDSFVTLKIQSRLAEFLMQLQMLPNITNVAQHYGIQLRRAAVTTYRTTYKCTLLINFVWCFFVMPTYIAKN